MSIIAPGHTQEPIREPRQQNPKGEAQNESYLKKGSVLLVTLLVVSLLLMVVLTLVANVRMGLREIVQAQNTLAARNHARLGVELAIAELQRHAGPDQRITAPATTVYPEKDFAAMSGDLYDLYRNRAAVFGGALGPRRTYLTPSGRAQWEQDLQNWWALGEKHPRWTAVLDASLRADGGASDRYGEPVRNQTPVWLVSGNQGGAGAFTPLSALPADAVTLVGEGSAAGAAESVDGLNGYVRVPRVPVQTPDAAGQKGSYAFWVGDESLKANFTVLDPWFDETDITSSAYRNRLQVPQRIGWERLSGMADILDNGARDLNDPVFERISSFLQIALLDDHPDLPDRLRENFHHLTAHSRSLFTDTALGGLRKDLTVYFEGSGSLLSPGQPIADRSLYEPSDPRFGGASNAGFPRTAAPEGLPTWGELKDWHDNTPDSRAPVLAGYQFFTAFTHRNGQIQFHILPLITLWNPYDEPLDTASYRLEMRHNIGYWGFGLAVENPGYVDPNPGLTPADLSDGHMAGTYFIPPLQGVGWYDNTSSAFKVAGIDFRIQNLWSANSAGSNQPGPGLRFKPFDIGNAHGTALPTSSEATWVPYRIADRFGPGEVKVFSVMNTQVVDPRMLHNGSQTVLLENDYDPDFPNSFWFTVAEGLQKEPGVSPTPADTVRWIGHRLDSNTPATISARLHRGGDLLWEHLYTGSQDNHRWQRSNASWDDPDGNLSDNPGTWKRVYHFDDWQDEQKNISDTRFRDSPIQALANNRISPFLIRNWEVAESNPHPFKQTGLSAVFRAFANYNVMASVMDPIPELDLARGGRGEHNADAFQTLRFFQSHRGDQSSNWYDNQVSGHNSYALMGWQHEHTALQTAGMSNLVLRQTRADFRLLSLGRLQQANLARYLWQPGFAIGNSEASPYVDRAAAAGLSSYALRNANSTSNYLLNLDQRPPNTLMTFPNDTANRFLDLSYVMNEALWDRYFLSSIPQTGLMDLQTPLANSRHRIRRNVPISPSELRDEELAAALLYNVGALNVNSTSTEAWRALFTAFRDLRIEGRQDGESNPSDTVPISRSLAPALGMIDFHEAGGTPSDFGANASGLRRYDRLFQGFRYLTDAQIEALADRIVDEVRLRGPFYSIADFVNRRLVDPDRSGGHWETARTRNQSPDLNHMHTMPEPYDPMRGLFGLQGALQRAVNLSGINGGMNHPHADNPSDRVFRVDQNLSDGIQGHPMSIYPAAAFYLDTEHLAGTPVGEVGHLMSHAPGFVTQADLLAMIGPALTARGDTFVIRSYGDSTSADGSTIQSRAWLEVTVQRVAEPVSPAGNTGAARYEPADVWGRRFVIVSQRWLLPDEI